MIKPLEAIPIPSHIMLQRHYLSAINSIRLSEAIARAKTAFTGIKMRFKCEVFEVKNCGYRYE